MSRVPEWRLQNDRALNVGDAEARVDAAERRLEAQLAKSQRYVLEGQLDKDGSTGWVSHYKLSGRWIIRWMEDALPELRDGRKVRITVEELD